ncbi:hypothetical protein C7B62_17945 [Pleurocapsa sp. CCALA 161]|uniref:polysialyltransferase family glycosyltransferase n=1 Tax=Pleurocapsa sp. CCALA 161 TaxID=2107688 RepID=UPI000D0615C6|nr:polysialyltransferase family glycosyltransferase [Pleurocapsa sp. CCALA 161]PSB08085.1 hypothetical protein C7B62_17945 [Pleurocapsa sp. CCALA 161]
MKTSRVVKRIITCQGSIQLVTALSVIDYREQERSPGDRSEDYLVIYDLNSPTGQIDDFVALIKEMAQLICTWKKITYLSFEQMEALSSKVNPNPSAYFQTVYELVGTDSADEIYLSRNWQFSNQLFTNAYRSAEKICYGDSIGIYFAPDSQAFFLPQSLPKQLLTKLSESLNLTKSILGYTVLQQIDFDRGYFSLPEILGEKPPMPVTVTDNASLLKIFKQLKSLLAQDYIDQLRQQIGDAPVSILLTSNFSEAGRMTLEQEIEAYREFLLNQEDNGDQRTILIIKPHPRDSSAKIKLLSSNLAEFSQIIILTEKNLFFIPFEVFFTTVFLDDNFKLTNQIKVFAFSSACLSLKLLFDVPSFIGFGNEITNKFFAPDYAPGRIKHEQDLKMALTKI